MEKAFGNVRNIPSTHDATYSFLLQNDPLFPNTFGALGETSVPVVISKLGPLITKPIGGSLSLFFRPPAPLRSAIGK